MRPPCWSPCENGRYKRLQEIQRILASKPFTFLLNFVDHTFGLFLYFNLKKSVKALVFETFQTTENSYGDQFDQTAKRRLSSSRRTENFAES